MENKTAVEWLFEKLWEAPKDKLNWYAIRKRAKQMERKQIEDAYNACANDGVNAVLDGVHEFKNASDYFTKTYNNGKDS